MVVPIKSHHCVICDETNPTNFYGKRKSLCKECTNKNKSKEKREDIRDKVLRPYLCILCGEEDIEKFYISNKSKCKICRDRKLIKKKKEIVVVTSMGIPVVKEITTVKKKRVFVKKKDTSMSVE
jgi:DnaJ-class molecular chaperone